MSKVTAHLNYARASVRVPRFHANDHSLDTVDLDARHVDIADARAWSSQPSLDREGGELFELPTAVRNFRNDDDVARCYPNEIRAFILDLTGADAVAISGPPILRFSSRSREAGTRDNSDAARLIHSDVSDAAALAFADQSNPHPERPPSRVAQHNIWRAFSGPPQDMPLALCDHRSVAETDIVPAEAAFDRNGRVEWIFEALLFSFSAAHRWYYYREMSAREVLVFKRHDTDRTRPWFVPHSAFEMPGTPADCAPRASVEARTIAYWYD